MPELNRRAFLASIAAAPEAAHIPVHGPSKLPGSFDARDWAREYVAMVKAHPGIPLDEATMVTWFANAIMAGYDYRYDENLGALA